LKAKSFPKQFPAQWQLAYAKRGSYLRDQIKNFDRVPQSSLAFGEVSPLPLGGELLRQHERQAWTTTVLTPLPLLPLILRQFAE
jgi:hypothetical protein